MKIANKAESVGAGNSKIFISCGQRTPEEKALGQEIQALVRELTPFEPYLLNTKPHSMDLRKTSLMSCTPQLDL